jgi:hypothetical protein
MIPASVSARRQAPGLAAPASQRSTTGFGLVPGTKDAGLRGPPGAEAGHPNPPAHSNLRGPSEVDDTYAAFLQTMHELGAL